MATVDELNEARAAEGVPTDAEIAAEKGKGRSIAERARANGNGNGDGEGPDVTQEPDGQFAIVERGRKITLGNIIKRGVPVEYQFKLAGKAVKGKGEMGLIGFDDPELTLLVPGRAGKVEVDPTYDADGTVKKVTIRAHFKPHTVYDSASREARGLLGLPVDED